VATVMVHGLHPRHPWLDSSSFTTLVITPLYHSARSSVAML